MCRVAPAPEQQYSSCQNNKQFRKENIVPVQLHHSATAITIKPSIHISLPVSCASPDHWVVQFMMPTYRFDAANTCADKRDCHQPDHTFDHGTHTYRSICRYAFQSDLLLRSSRYKPLLRFMQLGERSSAQ